MLNFYHSYSSVSIGIRFNRRIAKVKFVDLSGNVWDVFHLHSLIASMCEDFSLRVNCMNSLA